MLTELKEAIIKEVKEGIMTMLHQIGNSDTGIGGTKKRQMEILQLKSTITEIIIKKSLEGLSSRFELAEERISELENRPIEIMKAEEQKKSVPTYT